MAAKHAFNLNMKCNADKKRKTRTQSMLTPFLVKSQKKSNSDNASTNVAAETRETSNANNGYNCHSEGKSNQNNVGFAPHHALILLF